jgi:tRNA pseudouridine13 synthase
MRLKQFPADFRVEECTDVIPTATGDYALYVLEKEGRGTLEVVEEVARKLHVERKAIGYGGLKDAHARTRQHLTIRSGPRRGVRAADWRLEYLGQVATPFRSANIRANRFHLVVRQVAAEVAPDLARRIHDLRSRGFPNYFDDQRFGSVGPGGDFVARRLFRGEHEAALQLALTTPYGSDRAIEGQKKQIKKAWGDWARLARAITLPHVRPALLHLANRPGDFLGALGRLDAEQMRLFLQAYQSDLWNRWLSCLFTADRTLTVGEVTIGPRRLAVPNLPPPDLEHLPYPTMHLANEPAQPMRAVLARILAADGLTLEQLAPPPALPFGLAPGTRAVWCRPAQLQVQVAVDEYHAGFHKLILRFELPRGAYATMLVKSAMLHA